MGVSPLFSLHSHRPFSFQAVRIAEEKQMRAEQHREERLRELARRLQQRNDRQSQIRLRREETEICMKEEIESKQAKATALRQSYLKEVCWRFLFFWLLWIEVTGDHSLSLFLGPPQGQHRGDQVQGDCVHSPAGGEQPQGRNAGARPAGAGAA